MTTEDKDNAITPEKVKTFLDDFYADKSTPNAWLRLSGQTINICNAHLKLHEENTRLKQKLLSERGCDVDGCSAHFKAFSEENARLREELEHERFVNQSILKDFSEAMAEWRKEIEKNALKEKKK